MIQHAKLVIHRDSQRLRSPVAISMNWARVAVELCGPLLKGKLIKAPFLYLPIRETRPFDYSALNN